MMHSNPEPAAKLGANDSQVTDHLESGLTTDGLSAGQMKECFCR